MLKSHTIIWKCMCDTPFIPRPQEGNPTIIIFYADVYTPTFVTSYIWREDTTLLLILTRPSYKNLRISIPIWSYSTFCVCQIFGWFVSLADHTVSCPSRTRHSVCIIELVPNLCHANPHTYDIPPCTPSHHSKNISHKILVHHLSYRAHIILIFRRRHWPFFFIHSVVPYNTT